MLCRASSRRHRGHTLVETVLHGCPGVSVLATSREPLGVPGETVWRVPSLKEDKAIELFADWASLVVPGFDVHSTPAEVRAVRSRVNNIPLATLDDHSGWSPVGRVGHPAAPDAARVDGVEPRAAGRGRESRVPSHGGVLGHLHPRCGMRRRRGSGPGRGRDGGPIGGQVAGVRTQRRGPGPLPAAGHRPPVRAGAAAGSCGQRARSRRPGIATSTTTSPKRRPPNKVWRPTRTCGGGSCRASTTTSTPPSSEACQHPPSAQIALIGAGSRYTRDWSSCAARSTSILPTAPHCRLGCSPESRRWA